MLKEIGSRARIEIENLLDCKINLQLWVKVRKNWRDNNSILRTWDTNRSEEMGVSKTEGIVLKYTNLGEADKILTILTRNKGKIKAIAKGCRKPKSSLTASSEIFVFSEFVFYKGANLYHVTQAETRETFYNIRNDLLRLSYAVYFAELADTVSDEEIPSERLFILLAKTLLLSI